MILEGLPKGGKGYKEASLLLQAEIRRLFDWLVEVHAAGAPSRDPAGGGDAGRWPWTTLLARPSAEEVTSAGTVAIVGFPNVGKSTLVNRLTESRAAVVHETAGVTRDRKELLCDWNGVTFRVIDTGGVDEADTGPFGRHIAAQARLAVEESDLVLFVVDARAGVTPGDEEIAAILRLSAKPVIVLVNKIDDPRRDLEALEFHRLGLGDPVPLSALHGHGTGDLLDEIVARLPGRNEVIVGDEAIRVAILGRPNVGKSSLLNALVGEERVIVSDVPGRPVTRSTRCSSATGRRSSSSTRRASDGSGGSGRASSTTRSSARSRPRSARTSRSSSSTRPRGSSSRTSRLPTSRARRDAPPSSCSRSGTSPPSTSRRCGASSTGGCASGRRRSPSRRSPAAGSGACSTTSSRSSRSTSRASRRRCSTALSVSSSRPGPARPASADGASSCSTGPRPRPGRPDCAIYVNDPRLVTRDYGYWVENELRARFELQGVPVSIDFQRSE